MRLVRLTGIGGEELYVNPNRVAAVIKEKNSTMIAFSANEDDYIRVRELPQIVVNLLETGYKDRQEPLI